MVLMCCHQNTCTTPVCQSKLSHRMNSTVNSIRDASILFVHRCHRMVNVALAMASSWAKSRTSSTVPSSTELTWKHRQRCVPSRAADCVCYSISAEKCCRWPWTRIRVWQWRMDRVSSPAMDARIRSFRWPQCIRYLRANTIAWHIFLASWIHGGPTNCCFTRRVELWLPNCSTSPIANGCHWPLVQSECLNLICIFAKMAIRMISMQMWMHASLASSLRPPCDLVIQPSMGNYCE